MKNTIKITEIIYAYFVAKKLRKLENKIDSLPATNLDNLCEREQYILEGEKIINKIPEHLRDTVNSAWLALAKA